MSIPLVVDNVTYNYPTDNDLDWGYQASEWAAAITDSVVSGGGSGGLSGLNSIADLRALVRTIQTRVSVISYYGDNNGGGGVFYYVDPVEGVSHIDDAGVTIVANDGTVWKRANVDTINVKWFGARGNGTGDDAPTMQAALDYAGQVALSRGNASVYIPAGVYPVFASVDNYLWLYARPNRTNYAALFVDSNVTVFGDGWGSKIKLMSTPSSPGTTDGRGDYATTHILANRGAVGLPSKIVDYNIYVHDLGFDGNLIHESGECVTLCAVSQFAITNCFFENTFFECSYMVYSRNGLWMNNHSHKCGLPPTEILNDGGGPMLDTCSHVIITNNTMVDIGYYAVLVIDSWDCSVSNNIVKEQDYPSSAGYQAIRVQGGFRLIVENNKIWRAGYNGIWVNNSNNCIIRNNVTIQCGFGSGGGNQIAGIQVEADKGKPNGGHLIDGNYSALNKGGGISCVDAYTQNDIIQYQSGHTITNNTCVYNGRDGIAVYGENHRLTNNVCSSNGTDVTDGVVGNGYSGISLAGAKYCLVSGNTCLDWIVTNPAPMNLDAWVGESKNTFAPVYITHPVKTQNYGIYEGIGFLGELQVNTTVIKSLLQPDPGGYWQWKIEEYGPPPAIYKSGVVRYTAIINFEGQWVDLYGDVIAELSNDYYTVASDTHWEEIMLASMSVYTVDGSPHNLLAGSTVLLSDRRDTEGVLLSGLYTVLEVTSASSFIVNLEGYYPQPKDGDYTGELWISETIVPADYNIITGNNVRDNMAVSGIGHYQSSFFTSGVNSTIHTNIGQ